MITETSIETSEPETRQAEVIEELQVIAARPAGLTPITVLDVAKNPRSCLHKFFIWDDTEAARRYRQHQAYQLIRSVKVTILPAASTEPVRVRAFFPVKRIAEDGTYDPGPGHYLPVTQIMDEEDSMQQVINRAISELHSFQNKYAALQAVQSFGPLFEAIYSLEDAK